MVKGKSKFDAWQKVDRMVKFVNIMKCAEISLDSIKQISWNEEKAYDSQISITNEGSNVYQARKHFRHLLDIPKACDELIVVSETTQPAKSFCQH